MSKKRLMVMLLACTVCLSALTGCSTKNTQESSKKDNENVQLRFSWWGDEVRHKATLQVIDMYMKQHPNVKIEAEYGGKSDQQKIATQLAGGTVADIVQLNQPWMADMTAAGDFFVDYQSKSNLIDLSGFDQKFLKEYGVYKNKLIGLPTGLNACTTLMNYTTAKKYNIPTGIGTKWTWDDLYNTGKTVNHKDSNEYFLNTDTRTLGTFVLRPYIKQITGQQFIKDDYTLGFTKENLVQALTYISKLYKDKVVQPVQESNVFMDVASTNPKWINGNIVSQFMWTSQIGGSSKGIKGDTGVFIIPMNENKKDSGIIVQPSQLLAVSSRSKNIDEAVKFVNFFFNDVEAGKILKDCRSIPPVEKVRKACLDNGLLDKKVVDGVGYGLANAGMADNAPSSNAEVEKIITDSIEKTAFGKESVDSIADETIKLLNNVLKSLKENRK